MSPDIGADWHRVMQLRQDVRSAQTLPQRIHALCTYQGELALFVDRHEPMLQTVMRWAAAPVAAPPGEPVESTLQKERSP